MKTRFPLIGLYLENKSIFLKKSALELVKTATLQNEGDWFLIRNLKKKAEKKPFEERAFFTGIFMTAELSDINK